MIIADWRVRENLISSGLFDDPVLCANIKDILDRRPFLDSVPHPIKLERVTRVEVCGVASEFRVLFNSHYDAEKEAESTIDLNGVNILCDYDVYITLKCVVLLGTTKNEERAMTCRDMFVSILKLHPKKITRESMLDYLLTLKGYYAEVIADVIIECCFKPQEQILAKIRRYSPVSDEKFFHEIINHYNLKTIEDYNDMVLKLYVFAKKDEYFWKNVKMNKKNKDDVVVQYLHSTQGAW